MQGHCKKASSSKLYGKTEPLRKAKEFLPLFVSTVESWVLRLCSAVDLFIYFCLL